MNTERVIITGATGFVGRHVWSAMKDDPREIICTTRAPDRARLNHPDRIWERLDVDDPESIEALLEPGDRVFYLIHEMGAGGDYAEREEQSARAFSRIAREKQVARIVYLGGTKPRGEPSRHLASRLKTGELFRNSGVPTVELRAGMIVGPGSESWRIARDLAARLPVMLTPRWLKNRTEPIAIEDVVAALCHALDNDSATGAHPLPGPEVMSFGETLMRIARQRNVRPVRVPVPFLTPRLSSHWLRFVTGADLGVARELVEGLKSDLVSPGRGYWKEMPEHELLGFDEAVARALETDRKERSLTSSLAEELIRRLTPSA